MSVPSGDAPSPMLSVAEARAAVLVEISVLGAERVALPDALGRVLAEAITAPGDIPSRANTAMDGFAVRAEDVATASPESPVTLDVVATLAAGYVSDRAVGPGQAVRIMTGAPIPDGADAIVMVEYTESEGERVRIARSARPGQHVRRRGEDVREGDTVLEPGIALGAGEIGVLASVRRPFVRVGRRPTVAIVSTGDELVEVGSEPGPGQIVNSNAFSLSSLAREAGAIPTILPIARDSLAEIARALGEASSADVILASGGVSVGEFDYVKAALDELGAELRFWRVAMKPGKPVVFASLAGKPFFGLPGNPVSCMVGFHLFVQPALRRMMGAPDDRLMRPVVDAVLANDVRSSGDRPNYQRAVVTWRDGGLVATTKPAQGSGVLSSMVGANGLVLVPEGTRQIATGERVTVQLIGDLV